MKDYERKEIATLPDKYKPLTAWGYFGYMILFSIPIVGFIFLVVFAISDGNINRRSFARSYFCSLILVLIIVVVVSIMGAGSTLIETIKQALSGSGK